MKAKLSAGTELDFVSPDELREIAQEVLSGFLRPPQTANPDGGIMLDASGNTPTNGSTIFTVPAGYHFRLHRAAFFPDGYTFGAPFTAAGGYIDILSRGHRADGVSFDPTLNAGGLPIVWSAGTADGIDFENGDRVAIRVVAGPASTSLMVRLQGTLEPIVRQ